jgi:hypothetical protein
MTRASSSHADALLSSGQDLEGLTRSHVYLTARHDESARGTLWVVMLSVVSVLAMIWLWRETGDYQRVAAQSEATLWYILPSLPMFVVLPLLLRGGVTFWLALTVCLVLTAGLYCAMAAVLARFGYRL